jgi:hypothetical protein
VSAKVFLSQQEALALAFPPPAKIQRQTTFLSPPQLELARRLAGAGVDINSALVIQYVGKRSGQTLGTAYFDSHVVRTFPETVMIVISPAARIERIEVLSFSEPEEYLPRPAWLDQFDQRNLVPALSLKGEIHGLTGATLTARAITEASRRVLALHLLIEQAAQVQP